MWYDPAKGLPCECPDRKNKVSKNKPRVATAEWEAQEGHLEENEASPHELD
jgi:hypothetical protein